MPRNISIKSVPATWASRMAVAGVGGRPVDGIGQDSVGRVTIQGRVPRGQAEGCNDKRPAFSPSTAKYPKWI